MRDKRINVEEKDSVTYFANETRGIEQYLIFEDDGMLILTALCFLAISQIR